MPPDSTARRWLPAPTLARGRVRLAEGDAVDEERFFSEAASLWNEVGAPYETALARMALAEALRAGGSERQADSERQAARTVLDGVEAAPPTDSGARRRWGRNRRAACLGPQRLSSRGRLLVAGVRGRTARCETSKGCPLARLPPTPAGSSTHSTLSPPSVGVATALRRPGSHGTRRCRGDARRTRQECVSPTPRRDRRRHRAGAPSEIPSGSRRPTSNATSSFESCRTLSAWAVAIDEPRRRPSVPESGSPARSATRSPGSASTTLRSASISTLLSAPARTAATFPTLASPRGRFDSVGFHGAKRSPRGERRGGATFGATWPPAPAG